MNYYMRGGQVEAGGAPLDWVRASRFNRSRTRTSRPELHWQTANRIAGFTVTVEFSFCGGPGDLKPAPHSPELYGAVNLRHRRMRWNSYEK